MIEEPSPSARGRADRRTQARDIAIALRNTLKLGGSLVLTWSVALVIKLQLPRHLGPIGQGHYGFAESFAAMFFAAIGLGVDTYVMKEVSVRPKHASEFVGGIFALRALMSFVLFVVMAVTLYVTGRPREIQLAVFVFGLSQLVMSIGATISTVLQATTKVGRVAVANVVSKAVWGAGLLLGLHFNVPLYVLALSVLVSEVARLVLLVPAASTIAELHYTINPRAVVKVVIESLPFFVSAVAVGWGNNLAMSALGFMRRDEREVGWFAATQNLATLAMVLTPFLFWIVMPLLSRANARSQDEMMAMLRRCIEGLVLVIAPITVFISVASDVLIKLAFKAEYAPAAAGLSILSLVFAVTYVNMILSSALVVLGKSWPVTIISLAAIVLMTGFMVVFVPIGRAIFHVGGECAGAALAVISNESCVVIALMSRFTTSPFDSRNLRTIAKTAAVAAIVIASDRLLRPLGPMRLGVDVALYLTLALLLRLVRISDARRVIDLLRTRREEAATDAA